MYKVPQNLSVNLSVIIKDPILPILYLKGA